VSTVKKPRVGMASDGKTRTNRAKLRFDSIEDDRESVKSDRLSRFIGYKNSTEEVTDKQDIEVTE